MKKSQRGKVNLKGKPKIEDNPYNEQKGYFLSYIFIIALLFLLIILFFSRFITINITSLTILAFLCSLAIIYVVFIFHLGFEKDILYENGLSTHYTSFFNYMRDKGYISFNNIKIIGYGESLLNKFKGSEFIVVYKNEHDYPKNPAIGAIYNLNYKNNYYSIVKKTLKNKCPEATWNEVDWDTIDKNKV